MSESLEDRESAVREAIRAGRVRTWADGFGRWYAAVPESMAHPMGVAKLAIRLECRDRNEADYADRMPTVDRVTAGSGEVVYREADPEIREAESSTCRHCHRAIVLEDGRWVDPEAGHDIEDGDGVWRETCDEHDTFVADHEPTTEDGELEDIAERQGWTDVTLLGIVIDWVDNEADKGALIRYALKRAADENAE